MYFYVAKNVQIILFDFLYLEFSKEEPIQKEELDNSGTNETKESSKTNGIDPSKQSTETIFEGDENDAGYIRMCKGMSLCVAYAANIGGTGSLSGTGPNLIMQGQADQ